jgi:proteasome lid subunit RPN8/RPN11
MSGQSTSTAGPGPDITLVAAEDWPRRPLQHISGKRHRHFQAVIHRRVLDEIHAHGRSSTDCEVCGVLIGNVHCDDKGPYLHIHGSIRGNKAQQQATQVTFTSDTWDHIHDVMERQYPKARMVGWYHTHPGFGVFLSGMDLFIQDNFFNLPWQVAFVYDPTGGDEGMFVWRKGKSERDAFLIEESEAVTGQPDGNTSPHQAPSSRRRIPHGLMIAALCVTILMVIALLAFILSRSDTGIVPADPLADSARVQREQP